MPSNALTAAVSVLQSDAIATGNNVEQFEERFGEYIGNRLVTSAGDGSSALTLALYMSGVRPDDEVLACPMSCLSTTMPVKNLFAEIRWCDLNPLTGNIDPRDTASRISSRTKAVILFPWAGNPVEIDEFKDLVLRHGVKIIEDAAEGLGAEYKGNKIGATGADFTVFSFFPNRHITTIEGAAITFKNPDDWERARWLKRYGIRLPLFRGPDGEIDPSCDIPESGYNSYLNNVAAAIGLQQLAHLSRLVERHQDNGAYYDRALQRVPGLTTLARSAYAKSAFWVYTFLAERRDLLLRRLREHDICASKVHARNDIYSCFGRRCNDLPGVDRFEAETISIPSGWWVSDEDREFIVDVIKAGW